MKVILGSLIGAAVLAVAAGPIERPQSEPLPSNTVQMASMVLNGYSHYPRNIGSAAVYDMDGNRVGVVQKLEADPIGKPSAMTIWLPSGHTVRVEASNVGYDEQQNIVTVGLTDTQLGISQTPAAGR